jgi:hypothetical protein
MPNLVLILGGTAEARALARALVAAGVPVVSSLAGRVRDPALPVGEVRIGGFGGASGLAAWVRAHQITTVVDATHPLRVDDDRARRRRLRRGRRLAGRAAPAGLAAGAGLGLGRLGAPRRRAAALAGQACLPHHRAHEPRRFR